MCTAISFQTKAHYFGRNLDLEYHYKEAVTITPRQFSFPFRIEKILSSHYAMIGMATVVDDYPLYYDATNEYGLSVAGLNFPDHARYLSKKEDKNNIAPFELIPWVLSQCKSVDEAQRLLQKANITNIDFCSEFPNTPLHWLISDRRRSIVVEPGEHGILLYQNEIGVLTNNPPFPYHRLNLCNYRNVTRSEVPSRFSESLELLPYSRGMGGIGLPGDLSSASRFVRAAFTKLNSVCDDTESASVQQFFHILDAVAQAKGCAEVNNAFEFTFYSSCCNTDKGIYYYKTYENQQLTAVCLHNEELNSNRLIQYPLRDTWNVFSEN